MTNSNTVEGEPIPVSDDDLLREAAELRGAAGIAPAPGEPAAPAGPVDWATEAAELVEWTYSMFVPLFPRLAPIYTEEKRKAIAGPLAAVCEKHGFTLGQFFKQWGPEFLLAAAVAPVIVPTVRAVRADLDELQASKAAAAAAPDLPAAPAQADARDPRSDRQAPAMPVPNFGG